MKLKYIYQKITRGYSDAELWDLDYTLAKYILPRLTAFRKASKCGHPGHFKSLKEWNGILDKMIWSFNYIVNEDEFKIKDFVKDNKKCLSGLDLFGKYFLNLWD